MNTPVIPKAFLQIKPKRCFCARLIRFSEERRTEPRPDQDELGNSMRMFVHTMKRM